MATEGTEPARCACGEPMHDGRRVALTGGPGAGKTATLEVLRRSLCDHVDILPEAASILFAGGFPRRPTAAGTRAAQRAIYHVQDELERMAQEERQAGVVLCDRGTLDGLAYWADTPDTFFEEMKTTREAELARYVLVIHLRTPACADAYNHRNPIRTETQELALAMDAKVEAAWESHPNRVFVESSLDFMEKLQRVVSLVQAALPPCCQKHPIRLT